MNCFAYIRVSTTKQRDQGVSLEAQEEAIKQYARKHGLTITRWFRETKTAATRGRGLFADLIKRLKAGEAQGAIVHKIDRSARNLRDWSDFIGLMEHGISIHVASENLDLTSRGGRLSADIQAVVAADYIRNLRLEALKGIRGRYQQGLLPGYSPVGYDDNGSGQVKTINPVSGPLVRDLFERYATGRYSLRSLRTKMNARGLRNKRGGELSVNSVAKILHQPFYTGVIHVKRTGETFPGRHEPLISRALYQACQDVLNGRVPHDAQRQHFTYSRLVKCALCSYSLIAELQKGHVYYRCHTKDCPLTSKREDVIEAYVSRRLSQIALTERQKAEVRTEVETILGLDVERQQERQRSLVLEIQQTESRLERLTDLLLDDVIAAEAYQIKKRSLTEQLEDLREERDRPAATDQEIRERVAQYLEQASSARLSYESGSVLRKRQIVETTTSNLSATQKGVAVELQSPFSYLAESEVVCFGGEQRDKPGTPGTCRPDQLSAIELAQKLIQTATEDQEADTGESP